MTIDEFWTHYNHCPYCESYKTQGELCDGCKWEFYPYSKTRERDRFIPNEACIRNLNREVTEFE